jgi:outer membrane protein OmpA-like peptidoglycan-associated protein
MRKIGGLRLTAVAALSLIPACAMSPVKREGMLIGAAAGAMFSGAAACGTAAATGSNNSNALAIACPIGIAGGALIGGTIGYLTAYSEAVEGPPPPPPIVQQPAQQLPTALGQQASAPAPTVSEIAPLPTPSSTPTSTPVPQLPSSRPAPAPPKSMGLPPPPPRIVAPPSPLPVPPHEAASEEKIVLQGVLFAKNSSDLRARDMRILDVAADVLKAHPYTRIYIKGYSDSRGSARLNQKLSQERAATVAAYLESSGIPLSQFIVLGMGAAHPIATNATAAGRAKNRRVELEPVSEEP